MAPYATTYTSVVAAAGGWVVGTLLILAILACVLVWLLNKMKKDGRLGAVLMMAGWNTNTTPTLPLSRAKRLAGVEDSRHITVNHVNVTERSKSAPPKPPSDNYPYLPNHLDEPPPYCISMLNNTS